MKIKEVFNDRGLMHRMRFLFDKSAERQDEDIHTDFNYDFLFFRTHTCINVRNLTSIWYCQNLGNIKQSFEMGIADMCLTLH